MSAIPLTKMEIDILVQLALHGPTEASHWRALVKDADELGIRLWTLNVESTGDTDVPVSSYKFELLPIGITAAEGIKHCNYYLYQTGDEEVWKSRAVGGVLFSLMRQLPSYIPEVADAPWGWGLKALTAREDREPPVPDSGEPEVDEDYERLRAWWENVGLPLNKSRGAHRDLIKAVGDPRDIRAVAFYRPEVHSGFPAVEVMLASGVEVAEKIYAHLLAQRHRREWPDSENVHLYRFGDIVIDSRFNLDRQVRFSEEFEVRIAAVGEPDRHWWSGAPPQQSVSGSVLETWVRLTRDRGGTHSTSKAMVARNPKELNLIVEMIEDPELRERLRAVPLASKSVILLRGVASIDEIDTMEVHERVIDVGDGPEVGHVLSMRTDGATMGIATAVVTDRLEKRPAKLVVSDPDMTLGMYVPPA